MRILKSTGLACLVLLALAGCREEEQGRPLDYEPGVYPGDKPSTPLSEETLSELRQRALQQGGVPAGGAVGAGGQTTGDDVRPPASEADKALEERSKHQSGN